jgi:glycine oxidase
LVEALRTALPERDVQIVTAGVSGLIRGDGGTGPVVGVETTAGEFRAPTVVAAPGAEAGIAEWLPEEVRPPVRPVKGQVVELRGDPEQAVCRRILGSERVYVAPRPDGRVILGATVEEMGFDRRVTGGGVHELLREAYRALPDVAELELELATSGLRPATPDNSPLVGPGALDGLLLATGHFRNGILLAPLTAEAVAAELAGEERPPALAVADPGRLATEGTGVR